MSANDIFSAAVAIARDIIDDRYSTGAKLRRLLTNRGIRIRDFDACDDVASEFAAPYLQRIAELEAELRTRTAQRDDHIRGGKHDADRIAKLEAENKSLRDAAQKAFDVYDNATSVDMPVDAHTAMSALGRTLRGAS
mgnify:CR=1 FL=1